MSAVARARLFHDKRFLTRRGCWLVAWVAAQDGAWVTHLHICEALGVEALTWHDRAQLRAAVDLGLLQVNRGRWGRRSYAAGEWLFEALRQRGLRIADIFDDAVDNRLGKLPLITPLWELPF